MKSTNRIPLTEDLRLQVEMAEDLLGGRGLAAIALEVSDRTLLRIQVGAALSVSRSFVERLVYVLKRLAGRASVMAGRFEAELAEEEDPA